MRYRNIVLLAGIAVIFALYGGAIRAEERDASALYNKQCATCHGKEGKGDGEAAYLLMPRPRDFTKGKFRITTTDNVVPSDQDLFDTITRGMPGSAMPAWGYLSEKDRRDLVRYVRKLAGDGSMEKASKSPGNTRELPPFLSAVEAEKLLQEESMTAESLYKESCASCHGETGKGDGSADIADEDGYRLLPRDFTKGLFKGGTDPKSLAYRLHGMPGSAMPDFGFGLEDGKYLWALVHYIRSFIPNDAEDQVQYKRTLIAPKVDKLPTDPTDIAWGNVSAVYMPLMQLWQSKDPVKGLHVRVLHDGMRIAFQLTWRDASKNDTQSGVGTFGDATALQFSNDSNPPFFAMGDREHPVSIWMWKALKQSVKQVSLPITQHASAREAGNIVSDAEGHPVENLKAHGFGTLETQGMDKQQVSGKGVYLDGIWHVVLYRSLAASGKGNIAFTSGKTTRVGFAVWDGERGDRDGQKSVTVWHDLTIE